MDPDAIALATFLVREHDRATRDRDRTRTFPVMTATAGGRLDGIDTALAWLAGQYGHRSVEAFIGWVRARAPRPHPLEEAPAPKGIRDPACCDWAVVHLGQIAGRYTSARTCDHHLRGQDIPEGELRALDGNR